MQRISLVVGSLLVASAMGIHGGASQASLSQLGTSQEEKAPIYAGEDSKGAECGCVTVPCAQPCCKDKKCKPPLPPDVRNVQMNLDVTLTQIIHELEKEEVIPPVPGISEHSNKFVQETLAPVVVQYIENTVTPNVPTCTFPEGMTGEDFGLVPGLDYYEGDADFEHNLATPKKQRQMMEANKALIQAITAAADNFGIVFPDGMTAEDFFNNKFTDAEIRDKFKIEDPARQAEVEVIIRGFQETVKSFREHKYDEFVKEYTPEDDLVKDDPIIDGDAAE